MGLIKALTTAVGSGFGDQFKEYVSCPQIEKNVLIQRGIVNHGSGNKNYSEGVISNGSTIAVPQGMAMMIIDNGEIKEFSAEPGTYTWDSSSEPSIFTGGFFKGIGESIKTMGNRFTYGGMPARDQRVYYVNLLVVTGNKFGSPQPKKISDEKYGMLEVTFFGEYAFQIKDPVILVQNVIGANASDTVTYEEVIGSQLKGKFIEQLTKAITVVMRKHKVSFGDMGMYGGDLSDEMNQVLDESWHQQYGLEITDVSIEDINLTEESMARIVKIDDAAIFSDVNLQSGLMAQASAEALKNAAANEGGAMLGFANVNMAGQAGANMINAVNQNRTENTEMPEATNNVPEPGAIFEKREPSVEESPIVENSTQKAFCSNCGAPASGNFCAKCGHKLN